jgi:hypothetical protein
MPKYIFVPQQYHSYYETITIHRNEAQTFRAVRPFVALYARFQLVGGGWCTAGGVCVRAREIMLLRGVSARCCLAFYV